MWKVNGWQTMNAKWWQKLTLSLARWANNVQKHVVSSTSTPPHNFLTSFYTSDVVSSTSTPPHNFLTSFYTTDVVSFASTPPHNFLTSFYTSDDCRLANVTLTE
jgi:hypothetical protein